MTDTKKTTSDLSSLVVSMFIAVLSFSNFLGEYIQMHPAWAVIELLVGLLFAARAVGLYYLIKQRLGQLPPEPPTGVTYYCDTVNGSDSNPGTSPLYPLRTLRAARARIDAQARPSEGHTR